MLLHILSYLLSHEHGILKAGRPQKDYHLLPSVAGHQIRTSYGILEYLGYFLKNQVACCMPPCVIKVLEVVDIRHYHTESLAPLALCEHEFRVKYHHEVPYIGKLCEPISNSHLEELFPLKRNSCKMESAYSSIAGNKGDKRESVINNEAVKEKHYYNA